MSKQIIVKPQGVVTEPNKVGQFPPGAFARSVNCGIRSFGIAEQVEKWISLGSLGGGSVVGGSYAVTDGPLNVFLYEITIGTTWRICAFRATAFGEYQFALGALGAEIGAAITNDGRTGILLMRQRLIITAPTRSFAVDLYDDPVTGNLTFGSIRRCGLTQPALYSRAATNGVSTDAAMIAPEHHFSATTQLRLKQPDGYELLSPFALPTDYANFSSTLPQILSTWSLYVRVDTDGPSSSYKYEADVFRTRSQSIGYDSVNNKYIPVSTGSSFYLAKSYPKTNVGDAILSVPDSTMPNALGEALLTNVSVGGASALPVPPVPSKTCAVFRGHAFYAHRFDPATLILQSPFFWGVMNTATATAAQLANGVGERLTTGVTVTNGSPTITGFPNTSGVKQGQEIIARRTDNNVTVLTGTVVSSTGTTVTASVNSSYSGSVYVYVVDVIEINGFVMQITNPQALALDIIANASALARDLDMTAVGLEPLRKDSPGVYPAFVHTGGITFRMRTSAPLVVRATNGANYSPSLPEYTATAKTISGTWQKNGYSWSENNEPENCPPSNYAFCGVGEIYKVVSTRDCLWFFASDGLFRLSGNGGSVGDGYDWVLDPVDSTLSLCNTNCAAVYREYVYAYTNRGVVSISSEGVVREVSNGRINPAGVAEWSLPPRPWGGVGSPSAARQRWLVADVFNDEILVQSYIDPMGLGTLKIWAYNVKTDTWTVRIPSLYPGEFPITPVYCSGFESVHALYQGRSTLAASKAPGNSSEFEPMSITFQPIYGAGATAAHTQKHWQDLQISFKTPVYVDDVTCSVDFANTVAVTRTIPSTPSGYPVAEDSRVGFTVPRNAPALANALSFSVDVSATVEDDAEPIALEAISIDYIDFTDQRVRR
jgi:hypothetical protein